VVSIIFLFGFLLGIIAGAVLAIKLIEHGAFKLEVRAKTKAVKEES